MQTPKSGVRVGTLIADSCYNRYVTHGREVNVTLFTLKFLKDAAERVIASFAGALLAAGIVTSDGYFDPMTLKIAAGAAIASLLKAIVASQVGNKDSASLSV